MGKRVLVAVTVIVLVAITVIAGIIYWSTVNSPLTEQNEFRKQYGDVTLDTPTYNFSPPVTMYHALNTALIGDWNATILQNRTIHVSLDYLRFWSDSIITKCPYDNTTVGPSGGTEILSTVTQPVCNYSAVTVSNETVTSTYRYVWCITITENGKIPGCPNPMCWVDASTAEILPMGPVG